MVEYECKDCFEEYDVSETQYKNGIRPQVCPWCGSRNIDLSDYEKECRGVA
jgi:DNA-directed RNA polymerase subunit RPC12/RpoP